jgi:hypothetical protein
VRVWALIEDNLVAQRAAINKKWHGEQKGDDVPDDTDTNPLAQTQSSIKAKASDMSFKRSLNSPSSTSRGNKAGMSSFSSSNLSPMKSPSSFSPSASSPHPSVPETIESTPDVEPRLSISPLALVSQWVAHNSAILGGECVHT